MRILGFQMFLMFIFAFIFSLSLFAQLTKPLNLSFKNIRLNDALKEISIAADIHFAYNPQVLPLDKKINIKADNLPAIDVIKLLCADLELEYQLIGDQVILRPLPANLRLLTNRKYTLSGIIREKNTGEVIIGANIFDEKSLLGTISNAYGFYSLTLAEGTYTLIFSFIGFEPTKFELNLNENRMLDVSFEPKAHGISEIEVRPEGSDSGLLYIPQTELRLSSTTLSQLPKFAGNSDVIKNIQSIPGIVGYGDGSTFFYVRGGGSDQNLMLIDEAPIYNPSHLFGFFSALSPDAIKDVVVYKGDFPANYGGRLSSVIDIKAREGNLLRYGFSGNFGPFTSDVSIEGPIIRERSSFFLSGRRSNLNWLSSRMVNDDEFNMLFYDLNLKLNFQINRTNRLFFTTFSGNDEFSRLPDASLHTFGIQWKNQAATFRWNHIFGPKLFSNTTVYYSRYNYFLFISREQDDYWKSAIANASFKSDFSWFPNPFNTFKAGFEFGLHHSNPGNVHFSDGEIQKYVPVISEYNSRTLIFYLNHEFRFTPRLKLTLGCRLNRWSDYGPSVIYLFDQSYHVIDSVEVSSSTLYYKAFRPEPRISLNWQSGNTGIKLNWMRTVQFLQILSNTTSPFTSLEVWAPSGPNIKPQEADLFSAGIFSQIPAARLFFSLEPFYRLSRNQIDYEDHANMLYNPLIEGELRMGQSKSWGTEVMIRKEGKVFSFWLGYAWMRILKMAEDVNQNRYYPANYDRPHNFSISFTFNPLKRVSIATQWLYLSGSAISVPVGYYSQNGNMIPIYDGRNNSRLPEYHRLDLSVSLRIGKLSSPYRHSLLFSFYNLYGRKNPFSVNSNKIMNDNGDFVVPVNLDGDFEIVPTRISLAGMIPSINYTFRF
jgi:hypothetical protein